MASIQQLEKLYHIQSLCHAEDSLESAVATERVAQAIKRTEQLIRQRAFLREERRRLRISSERLEQRKAALKMMQRPDWVPSNLNYMLIDPPKTSATASTAVAKSSSSEEKGNGAMPGLRDEKTVATQPTASSAAAAPAYAAADAKNTPAPEVLAVSTAPAAQPIIKETTLRVNVSGLMFETPVSILCRDPDSLLAQVGALYIHTQHVISALRSLLSPSAPRSCATACLGRGQESPRCCRTPTASITSTVIGGCSATSCSSYATDHCRTTDPYLRNYTGRPGFSTWASCSERLRRRNCTYGRRPRRAAAVAAAMAATAAAAAAAAAVGPATAAVAAPASAPAAVARAASPETAKAATTPRSKTKSGGGRCPRGRRPWRRAKRRRSWRRRTARAGTAAGAGKTTGGRGRRTRVRRTCRSRPTRKRSSRRYARLDQESHRSASRL